MNIMEPFMIRKITVVLALLILTLSASALSGITESSNSAGEDSSPAFPLDINMVTGPSYGAAELGGSPVIGRGRET